MLHWGGRTSNSGHLQITYHLLTSLWDGNFCKQWTEWQMMRPKFTVFFDETEEQKETCDRLQTSATSLWIKFSWNGLESTIYYVMHSMQFWTFVGLIMVNYCRQVQCTEQEMWKADNLGRWHCNSPMPPAGVSLRPTNWLSAAAIYRKRVTRQA